MRKIFSLKKSESLKLCSMKIIIIVICSFIILHQLSCKKQTPSQTTQSQSESSSLTKPPDLSNCTRVEMKFHPSTKEYIFLTSYSNLLINSQETEYLQSLEKFILTDPKVIKVLSEDISSSTFVQKVPGAPGVANVIEFNCYYKDASQVQIYAIGLYTNYCTILVNDVYEFESNIRLNLIAPEIQEYICRVLCAKKLYRDILESFRNYTEKKKSYPLPAGWCDTIVMYRVTSSKGALACPCKAEGKCHYAMNPNCKPDSPDDMVLLFETKDGWNQHGGPELFTFDNHDPKGGCVLFNDGTVKFIRTEEELKNLRWK